MKTTNETTEYVVRSKYEHAYLIEERRGFWARGRETATKYETEADAHAGAARAGLPGDCYYVWGFVSWKAN